MDKHFTHINDDLLVSYLLGEASIGEREAVERWLIADSVHQKKLDDFKAILVNSELIASQSDIDPHHALGRVNLMIEDQKIDKSGFPLLRWAAVITVFIGLGYLSYAKLINQSMDVQSAGDTKTQSLPDGSIVILNRHSVLSYQSGVFKDERTVNLRGEAFFKVRANKKKPFIISVNNIKVTVVGTAFNVKGSAAGTSVEVEEGVVKVNQLNQELKLLAGESTVVPKMAGQLKKETMHGKLYSYYYTGKLICQDTPLSALIPVLNEKFSASIKLKNQKLASLTLTTTFTGETLPEILKVIQETFNIEITYDGKEILLN